MGDIICCKKTERELNIEEKDTIDAENDVYHDENEYPHDSDASIRSEKYKDDKPKLK